MIERMKEIRRRRKRKAKAQAAKKRAAIGAKAASTKATKK
jgi:hypothetical protein